MDKILIALGLAEGSGEGAVLTAVNSLLAGCAAFAVAAGMKDNAKHEDVLAAVKDAFGASEALGKIAASVQAGDDASAENVVTAVAAAVAGAGQIKPDPSKYVPIEQFNDLSKKVEDLTSSRADDKATEAVEAAMSDGKVAPAMKDWALEYAQSNLGGFKTYIASAPVIVAPQAMPEKKTAAETAATSEADAAVMSQLGISEDDFQAARKQEAA